MSQLLLLVFFATEFFFQSPEQVKAISYEELKQNQALASSDSTSSPAQTPSVDGFDEWKKKKKAGQIAPVDYSRTITENSELDEKQSDVAVAKPIVDLQQRAISEILDEYIKSVLAGMALAAIAGIYGLSAWLYSKVSGKQIESEKDETSGIEVASRAKRLANFAVDFFIVLNGLSALVAYFSVVFGWYGALVYSWATWLVLLISYYAIFEGNWGRTLGKLITGTMVVDRNGSKAKFSQIMKRTLVRLVPFEIFSLGGKNALGWHDRWSGTMVVLRRNFVSKTGTQPKGKAQPWRLDHSTWHVRLRNAAYVFVFLGWLLVYLMESSSPFEYLPQLFLAIFLSELGIWLLYKSIIYISFGKNS